jgi:hypothetical protein
MKDGLVAAVHQTAYPEKDVLKAVRQIMFNELGLNRNAIQQMVAEEIAKGIDRHIGAQNKSFDDLLMEALSNYIYRNWRGDIKSNRQDLQKKILKTAEEETKALVVKEVREILAVGLKIDIKNEQ